MHNFNDPMPADKMMKLFIIQSISSFVAGDYDSGVHYLNEIKQTYAEKMSTLNPTLKKLAKEIIQSVDLFNPDSSGIDASGNLKQTSNVQSSQNESTEQSNQEPTQQPSSVTSELQELLKRRRKKRKDRE